MGPLLVPLEIEFSISHTASTSLLFFMYTSYGISQLSSCILATHITHRNVAAWSTILIGCSLIFMATAKNVTSLQIAFVLFGLAAGLYFPSGMATLASIVERKFWGKAVAIHELAPNLAFITSPLLVGAAMQFTDWRGLLQGIGYIAIVSGFCFWRWGKGGSFTGEAPNMKNIPALLQKPETWIFTLLIAVCLGLEVAPYSVLPLFLVNEHAMTPTSANNLLAASRIICPFLALTGGWCADTFGAMKVIRIGFLLSGIALCTMALSTGPMLSFAVTVQGALPALMFPALFMLLAELFTAKTQALVLALGGPLTNLTGTGILPFLLGWFGDWSSFSYGFIVIALLSLSMLFTLPILQRALQHAQGNDEAAV